MLVARLHLLGMLSRLCLETRRYKHAQAKAHDHDQEETAHELGQRELPADQDPHHETKLPDEIGRGELEGKCRRG
jgi:hypothetical protein